MDLWARQQCNHSLWDIIFGEGRRGNFTACRHEKWHSTRATQPSLLQVVKCFWQKKGAAIWMSVVGI